MVTIGTREAAKRLGLSRHGVHKRIKRGTLKATRIGRDWRIKPSDLGKGRR